MPLLDRSNLIHAFLMTAACEWCFKPGRHNFTGYFGRNQTGSE
jgi:hypothetical protein